MYRLHLTIRIRRNKSVLEMLSSDPLGGRWGDRFSREVSGTLWQGRPPGGECQLWFQKSRSSRTRPSPLKRSNDTPARFSVPPSASLVCARQGTAA
jgi:hypothetical protein